MLLHDLNKSYLQINNAAHWKKLTTVHLVYVIFNEHTTFIQTNLLVPTAYRTDIQDEVVGLEISLVPVCIHQSTYVNKGN